MDAEIKQQFDRINKKLNDLLATAKKETWVGPGWITDLTGWDFRKMDQARKQKIIEFKESPGGGYLYKLESIPEQFLLKKQAS